MYDTETLTALESGALVLRDFLTVDGWELGGDAARFAYWTGEDNVTVAVVPAGAQSTENRNFVGGGTLLQVPEIVDAIGMEARSFTFGFDHISDASDAPMDMVFGHNVRVARVEFHRGVFDPGTWGLVSEPHLLLSGRVDGASVDDAAADGEGGLSIDVIGSAIDLTRVNPAMESDEQQRRRDGDRFRQYGDTAGEIERWWGMARDDD